MDLLFNVASTISFCLIFLINIVYAAAVTAPAKDQTYTFNVKNIGSTKIENVSVKADLTENPYGLVSIKGVVADITSIDAGGSVPFKVKFDVGCPTQAEINEEGKAIIKFGITTSTTGPLYIKNCGIDDQVCDELKGEFTVQISRNRCQECNGKGELVQTTKCAAGEKCNPSTGACEKQPDPGGDHPDDNYSVSNAMYPTLWYFNSKSSIGVLTSGWGEGLNYLLGKFKVGTASVTQDLTILKEPDRSINDLKVLMIGSGGLDGLESSPTFSKKIADYVHQGGTLICLDAKNGYEFNALPGGEVTGYGWTEDQSCLNAAMSIVKYHQMLSGQTTTNLDANVDGYFTKWPASATILLQRNKNGMPALLMYPYGKGTVIATSIFEDWAYGHNQSTTSGQMLVRDMVAWARMAKTLPEFAVGASVGFPLSVINSTGYDAQKVAITTLDPNRNILKKDTITLTIPANDTIETAYSFGAAPSNLGIWSVQYSLLTDGNDVVQDEQLGQMFVVSNPAGVAKTQDITFSVNSDDENYAYGSIGVFNIHVWNHTDAAKTVQVYYWFPHNLWATGNTALYGECSWGGHSSNLHESLNVPAQGEQTITVSVPLVSYDRLWAEFWDESFNYIGEGSRGFYVYTPSCQVTATTDKSEYKPGDDVAVSLNLKNTQNLAYTGSVNVKILSPDNAKIWENTASVDLPSNAPITQNVSFTLPAGAASGAYSVRVEVTNNGTRAGSYTTHFIIPEAFLAITPNLPGVLYEGDNAISFGIENYGLVGVNTGTLEAKLLNPAGSVVWSDTKDFNLGGGLTATVNFTMPVTSLEFGTYRLAYRAQYNGLYSKEAHKDLLSTCLITTSTDTSSYRIRQTIALDVGITNNGRFQYGTITCGISLPGSGDNTSTISLNPSQSTHIPVSLSLPETMTAGTHTGTITLTLPSGNAMSKAFTVTIPQSKIILSLDSANFKAGDLVSIAAENSGGVDASAKCSLFVKDTRGVAVVKEEQALNLKAGEKGAVNISIPANVVNGDYELTARAYNQTSSDTTVLIKTLSITGLLATLDVHTDKQVYTEAEAKTALADIAVSKGKIENGNLNLKVIHAIDNTKTWTTQEDWQSGDLYQVDVTTYPGDVVADVNAAGGGGGGLTGKPFLIIKDVGSWGLNANATVLQEKGIGYDQISSSTLTSWDIRTHGNKIIIVESDQYTSTYQNLVLNRQKIADFVSKGGILLAHSCDGGWNGGSGGNFRPGQENKVSNSLNSMHIVVPDHPVVKNLTDRILSGWSASSHGYFTGLSADTKVIISGNGFPIYIEYKWGRGIVLATMQTIEWPFNTSYNYGTKEFLRNEIDYAITLIKASGISLKFDAGKTVDWNTVTWTSDEPESTDVIISLRTADSLQGLASASWSENYSTSGATLNLQPGRWAEVRASLETPDPSRKTPVLHDLSVAYVEKADVWSDNFALNADAAQNINATVYPISGTGRFILEGVANNTYSQQISKDDFSFYVGNDPIYLTFKTDKKVYKPGETVAVTGQIINNSGADVTDLAYDFKVNGTLVHNAVVSIPAGSSQAYSFSFSAPSQLFKLCGAVEGHQIIDQIEVQSPELKADIDAPSIVGRAPFDFIVRLTNSKSVDVNVNVTFSGETQSITIPAGQSKTLKKQMSITGNSTVYANISGDVTLNLQKDIQFGEAIAVSINPEIVYPEGVVVVPYSIQNTGVLDSKVDVTFTMGAQTIVKQAFIPVGQTVTGELSFNQTVGTYSVAYNSYFGSGSADYRVAKPDKISMQLDVNRYATPKVLILRDYSTEGYIQPALESAGMEVTLSDNAFPWWDGTNPSPNGFDVVILPCANYYDYNMSAEAQNVLVTFVNNGGGFITTEWITYGVQYSGCFNTMSDLLLYEPSQWNYGYGPQTFAKIGTHPITSDLPESFYSSYYHYGNIGGLKAGATSILSGNWLPNVVAVKQQGKGRIVQFAIQGSYIGPMAQSDANWNKIILNSVNWAGKSFEGNSVRAKITLSNEGYNGFDGQLSSSTSFFAKTEDLALASGETKTIKYDMDISSVEPGTYIFKSSALNGGKALQQASQSFVIGGPELELSTTPTDNNFAPGQQITLNFGIKNKGMVEGKADIGLKFEELYDGSRTTWIAPGVEKQESFTFQIPDDYPEGEYKAEFKLNDSITEIPFTVSGVNLTVVASFDKPIYQLGETATLNLDITNGSALNPSVYAKASSNGNEDRKDFTLSDHQTIQLQIPVNEGTLSSIAYGIYMASGRAIHLNTIYIRIMKGAITLYTDKSVYNTGETVTVNVATEETGDLTVTSSTGYTNTIAVAGPISFSFVLPDEMSSGTQSINYQFGEISGVCNFDVLGYSLKVLNVTLNKQTYDPIDQLSTTMTVKSNKAVSAVVKGWLYAPTGSYKDLFEVTRDLGEGETDISVSVAMSTPVAGTHKLIYGIYSSGTNLTLVTGSKSFDVKPAAIVAVTPDKQTYSELDEVHVTVQTYTCAEYSGTVEIQSGSDVIASKAVILNGATDVALKIGLIAPGSYQLLARLKNRTDTASEKAFNVAVVDMNAPSAPVGLTLAMDGGIANLHWNANTEPDLAGYNAFRNGEKLNVIPFKTNSFRDEGLVAGVSYGYHITAVDKTGNESAPSSTVTARIDNTAPVITISPSSDVVSTTPITLTYSVVDDIDPNPTVTASHASPTTFRDAGAYHISIVATDAQGNRSQKTITITVNASNNSPQLAPIADKNIDEGRVLAFQLSASDPDDDALAFSANNLPAGADLNPSTGLFTWTPGYDQAGEYDITFTVTDNGVPPKSASQTGTIVVANINRPPVVAAINDTSINEEDTLRLTIQAHDPDGDPLVITTENAPAGAQLDASTGAFMWKPGYSQSGVYSNIKFIITDNGSPALSDTVVFSITVNNVNRPPVLASIGNKTVSEGENLSFTITAIDSDANTLAFTAGNLPTGAVFDPSTQQFSWTPDFDQAGDYQNVVFTVSDNGQPILGAQEKITITVGNVNRAPVLAAIGDKLVKEGDTLKFIMEASDPDGDPLTYSAGNLPSGASFDQQTKRFFWAPEFGKAGVYPDLIFTATDNGQPKLSDQKTISITVGHVNRPPVLAMIGNKTVFEGERLEFTVTASDPDGDNITYGAGNLPQGAKFDPATQKFSWMPDYNQAGNYTNVIFTVTDNGTPASSDQEAVTISVGDVNRPPVMASIGNKSINEGEALRFTVTATDPDADELTYSAGNLPAGAAFDPATQEFSWVTAHGQAGAYADVWFQATDDGYPRQSDRETITITVGKVNRAPVMAMIGDKTVDEGQTLQFTVTATDPDGDPLTFAASTMPSGARFDPATRVFSWTPANGQAGFYSGVRFIVSDGSATVREDISITVVPATSQSIRARLLSSGGAGISGGQVLYYSGNWKIAGTTDQNGWVNINPLSRPASLKVRMVYAGSTSEITQNVQVNPIIIFQTKSVLVSLKNNHGNGIASGRATYSTSYWLTFGSTDANGEVRKELLPGMYTFRVTYLGMTNDIKQDVGVNPEIGFVTKNVLVSLRSSIGQGIASGSVTCAGGYWLTFGSTGSNGEVRKELLPGMYTFRVTYLGMTNDIKQDVGVNPEIGFVTKNVLVSLRSSIGQGIASGSVTCAGGYWLTFGSTGSNGEVRKELLPGLYTFRVTYLGMSVDKNQNISVTSSVPFTTNRTVVTVKNALGNGIAGIPVTYTGSYLLTFGKTDAMGIAVKELIPGSYMFRASYGARTIDKTQNTNLDPMVTIQF